MIDIASKLESFRQLVESQTKARLESDGVACEANIRNATVTVKPGGKKYTKVNIGHSGRYMVEVATGAIFGIKGYGQVHRGHYYGTLDTINEYSWGGYYPVKVAAKTPVDSSGVPALTFAPAA